MCQTRRISSYLRPVESEELSPPAKTFSLRKCFLFSDGGQRRKLIPGQWLPAKPRVSRKDWAVKAGRSVGSKREANNSIHLFPSATHTHTHTHTHTRMQINCTDEWHENVASLWHALILLLVFTGRNISHRRGYVLSQVTYWFKQDAEALTTSFLGHFSIKVMQNNLFWRLSGSTLNLILFALSKGRGLFAQLSCWAFDQTDTMIMSVTETRADSLAKEKTPGCALTSSFRRGSIFSS